MCSPSRLHSSLCKQWRWERLEFPQFGNFYPHDVMLAWYLLWPCVHLSVTSWYCIETTGQVELVFVSWRLSSTHPTHTHTRAFNGPFSRTTQVSRYQKGKTNLDFTEARDSEWQWHQLSHMQVCTLLQTDSHTSTPPLYFLQAGCPSCRPTNSILHCVVKKLGYFRK